jgi:hypothetical protein
MAGLPHRSHDAHFEFFYTMGAPYTFTNAAFTRSSFTISLGSTTDVDASMVKEARNMMPLIVRDMPAWIPQDLKNKYYFAKYRQCGQSHFVGSPFGLFGQTQTHSLWLRTRNQINRATVGGLGAGVARRPTGRLGHLCILALCPDPPNGQSLLRRYLAQEEYAQMAKSLGLEILTDVAIKNWLMERYFG